MKFDQVIIPHSKEQFNIQLSYGQIKEVKVCLMYAMKGNFFQVITMFGLDNYKIGSLMITSQKVIVCLDFSRSIV